MRRRPAILINLLLVFFVCCLVLPFSYCTDQSSFHEKSTQFQEELFIPLDSEYTLDASTLEPTIFVALFVRNKEHTLPYFLRAFQDLNYSKKRISVWIVTDHNSDESAAMLEKWVNSVKSLYHDVQLEEVETQWFYDNQQSNLDWTKERHKRMLMLRQEAIDKARQAWSDYVLFIDADNILMNPHTLWHLITVDHVVVAPMLNTLGSYSNYWCGQDERGYYQRTDDYFPIKNREKVGVFEVPMIHSTFLIDLTKKASRSLQFWPLLNDYKLDLDDIIVFSYNCKAAGVQMYIDNRFVYGFMPIPLRVHQTLIEDVEVFNHLLMEVLTEPPVGIGIEIKPLELLKPIPKQSKLGFDEIYMINLVRRHDRFYRMKTVLEYQGIHFNHFKAIDSKTLNTTYLKKMHIDMLPQFTDPYRERTLTRGEIGCFLSHYFIWQEVVKKDMKQILILEDDIRFENAFVRRMKHVMDEIEFIKLDWDLVYIGRKRMQLKVPENPVPGTKVLVEADYSYWTLGYMLSQSGAKKLLAGDPLPKMVPVDEYLPIMFNKHPIQSYMDNYPVRNLMAFSVEPLLVYPTHYTGQENYFSDTETSSIWEEVGSVVYNPRQKHEL
uniref:Procollagen galactosyltransferase 1 n=1 Tax=Phallusia mammillata TaxID=59560 RepID=A0A6F9D9M4_9ASCI|nr:procollagen galactosyltransferase 1 [Phallusia mammillata]